MHPLIGHHQVLLGLLLAGTLLLQLFPLALLFRLAHTLLLCVDLILILVGLLLLRWTLHQRTRLTRIRWRRFRIWRRRRLLLTGHRNRARLSRRLLQLLVEHGLTADSDHLLLLLLLLLWPNTAGLVRVGYGLNDAIALDLLNDPLLLLLLLLTGHHVRLDHSTRVAHLQLLDPGWVDQSSPHSHGHVIVRGHNSDGTLLGQ